MDDKFIYKLSEAIDNEIINDDPVIEEESIPVIEEET